MADPAPMERLPDARVTSEWYLRLVDDGILGSEDRVELLEGVIVAMGPHNPRHASAVARVTTALVRALGDRGVVRPQLTLPLGRHNVPEPDVAVVAGRLADYDRAHPSTALLVVEVADSSLPQDRLTKAAIYAAASIPEYWIVNLRADRVDVHREPRPAERRYGVVITAAGDDVLDLAALADVRVAVRDLLPGPE